MFAINTITPVLVPVVRATGKVAIGVAAFTAKSVIGGLIGGSVGLGMLVGLKELDKLKIRRHQNKLLIAELSKPTNKDLRMKILLGEVITA